MCSPIEKGLIGDRAPASNDLDLLCGATRCSASSRRYNSADGDLAATGRITAPSFFSSLSSVACIAAICACIANNILATSTGDPTVEEPAEVAGVPGAGQSFASEPRSPALHPSTITKTIDLFTFSPFGKDTH